MTDRALRKDAAERRKALLDSARAIFAAEGIDTPLDRIAEHAGVGRATLYRNFPGRTEIALAVLMQDVTDLGQRFAQVRKPDVFLHFLAALSERLSQNAALGGVVRASPSHELLEPLRKAMREAGAGPLKVSQDAGVVRPDLTPLDLRVLSAMLGAGLHNAAPKERDVIAKRTLQLVLDAVKVQP